MNRQGCSGRPFRDLKCTVDSHPTQCQRPRDYVGLRNAATRQWLVGSLLPRLLEMPRAKSAHRLCGHQTHPKSGRLRCPPWTCTRMSSRSDCQFRLKTSHLCRSKISHFELAGVRADAMLGLWVSAGLWITGLAQRPAPGSLGLGGQLHCARPRPAQSVAAQGITAPRGAISPAALAAGTAIHTPSGLRRTSALTPWRGDPGRKSRAA